MSGASDETKKAGRGLASIAGAKLIFIVTGYAVALGLPRLFGSEQAFGRFSVAFSLAASLNNVLVVSTLQTMSKMVSEDEKRAARTLRHGLKLQVVVGGVLALAILLAAPTIAEGLLLDATLANFLRFGAWVIFAYALYATVAGYLNGRRDFGRQATLDMGFSILRTTGLLGGAFVGTHLLHVGAIGAMGGFACAAAVILLGALLWVGLGEKGDDKLPLKRFLTFMAPVWIYQAFLNGMLQLDLTLLKRTVTELALEHGQSAAEAIDLADGLSGYYRAAQTFAFVPYQLIVAVTLIIFPMVSKATSLGDRAATRGYVRGALRFSLLILVSLAAPIAGASEGVLRLAYPAAYAVGADALSILILGQVAFALFVIGATILTGGGRPGLAALIAGIGALEVVIGVRVAIGISGGQSIDTLAATALGTSSGTLLALVLVGLALHKAYGAFLPAMSVIRAAIGGVAGFWTAKGLMSILPSPPPLQNVFWVIVALAGGFFVYLLVLLVLRELGREDWKVARKILPGR